MQVSSKTVSRSVADKTLPAVILAAGEGFRLRRRNKGVPKPLTLVLGLTLLERAVLCCREVGIGTFYVVVGCRAEKVLPYVTVLEQKHSVLIHPVENANWSEGNGSSALTVAPYLDGPFYLLMCDHLFDPGILHLLLRARRNTSECLLAIDRRPDRVFDLKDATKVKLDGDTITAIGKGITSFDAIDTGLFLCQPSLFDVLEQAKRDGYGSLSAGMRELIKMRQLRGVEIGDQFWLDVDTPQTLSYAKSVLLKRLSKPADDGFISRHVNRPLSTKITRLLAGYQITPNQVSVLSFVIALISSLSFVIGNAIVGAFLIQLSSILDGCDGEIARLKYMRTSLGDFVDAVLDRYADSFILSGIFYYSLTEIGNREVFGFHWSPLLISIIFVLAIIGNLMVSYTSAKSVVNFGYRYRGRWIAAGKGRDIRLFQLFIGGMMTYFHPIFALFAMLTIAIQTNVIVLWRTCFSWKRFCKG